MFSGYEPIRIEPMPEQTRAKKPSFAAKRGRVAEYSRTELAIIVRPSRIKEPFMSPWDGEHTILAPYVPQCVLPRSLMALVARLKFDPVHFAIAANCTR